MGRSLKKGPFVNPKLFQKVERMAQHGGKEPIKTWARACTIVPEFVGHTFLVHNGKLHIKVFVTEDMVGHKLGEFAPTRTFRGHGGKGGKATKQFAGEELFQKFRDVIMAYRAVHKYARISATKVRPLADLIRGKHADEALDLLRYQPQRGARYLEKVLKSALGNAEDQRAINVNELIVVDARVDEGPMFKRIRPRARGMAFMIKRRMAHIHVAVE